jgi:hypothetical protein
MAPAATPAELRDEHAADRDDNAGHRDESPTSEISMPTSATPGPSSAIATPAIEPNTSHGGSTGHGDSSPSASADQRPPTRTPDCPR